MRVAHLGTGLVWAVGLVLLLPALVFSQVDVDSLPKPTGYVSDLAHVLTPEAKAELESLCADVDHQLEAQFAIVTIPKLGDESAGDFALELGRKWGVGPKGTREGLVIVISLDHHASIQVGRQLEPYITDGFAGDTRRAMTPELRAGDFGDALIGAVQTLANHLAQQKNTAFNPSARPLQPVRHHKRGIPGWWILVGIFFFLWLIGRGRRGGRPGGGFGGGGAGFVEGMVLGSLLNSGRPDSGGRGWNNDGGGFGGNDGGGGFGGFGGGGDFGGGGSSGDW